MLSHRFRRAVQRLENAPWPSPTTAAAVALLRQRPSDAALIQGLASSRAAPATLEVLSATQTDSEPVFEAVRDSIQRNVSLSWSLVESLNRLPWYNGIRAFLSLPDSPLSSPSAYCFYMLARNKIFIPTDVGGELYDYYFHGLWRMLSVAKSGNWHDLHDSVVAVLKLMRTHLEGPRPDAFVVYVAALLLGRIGPVFSSIQALRNRVAGDYDPAVKIVGALTLLHLDAGDIKDLLGEMDAGGDECRAAMSALATLAASRRGDGKQLDRRLSHG